MKRLTSLLLFASVAAFAGESSELTPGYSVSVPLASPRVEITVPAHPAHVTLTDRDEVALENHPAVEVALGHGHTNDLGKLALVGHPAHGF